MLSEKKSFITQQEIDFLGMHISHGRYSPGPHIALELLKFPDTNLSREQIQQFLEIINYIRDFLPYVAQYTLPLSRLLKKTPPPWSPVHTTPPPLHIPSEGLRILQTDASDCHWGALLLEERDTKRFYCAHASGSFKSSQQHYHTIYKEILAVKYGIEKFDFYLRGHTFKVEMDNSSFPRVLEFKNNIPPDPLLLRLKSWFERYDFQTSYIKGSQNIIPDMFSRPQPIHLLSRTSIVPVIYTLSPAMTEPSIDILNLPAKQVLSFPPDLASLPFSSPHPTSQEIKHFASIIYTITSIFSTLNMTHIMCPVPISHLSLISTYALLRFPKIPFGISGASLFSTLILFFYPSCLLTNTFMIPPMMTPFFGLFFSGSTHSPGGVTRLLH
ncbi:hypothetical protein ACOSP7_022018 [Xanthoceras sorbifolium]